MRYRSLGVDDANCSHIPTYPGRVPVTELRMGHPVLALPTNAQTQRLFIQVTAIGGGNVSSTGMVNVSSASSDMRFHVSVQNPETFPITARFVATFGPGGPPQAWSIAPITVPAGGSLTLL